MFVCIGVCAVVMQSLGRTGEVRTGFLGVRAAGCFTSV